MIRIYVSGSEYENKAMKLQETLSARTTEEEAEACRLVRNPEELGERERYLRLDEKGLALVEGKLKLRGDFRVLLPRVLGGHLQHEKLLRAARSKALSDQPLAVDATAGLGEDAFILASGGYSVVLCEHNPVIAALLADALDRAGKDSDLSRITARMTLVEGSSIDFLGRMERRPDLVYLDPMFPAKQKSGISKKKLQLFQKLEMPCSREEELMEAARTAGPERIVVKRPLKGPALAGKKPSHSIEGKNIRFDCYVFPRR